uniref:Uncharacterized protein n=1 Tax=Manihot esculenta TaxID=3983 RepID=A0A2C9VST3_MANES
MVDLKTLVGLMRFGSARMGLSIGLLHSNFSTNWHKEVVLTVILASPS